MDHFVRPLLSDLIQFNNDLGIVFLVLLKKSVKIPKGFNLRTPFYSTW